MKNVKLFINDIEVDVDYNSGLGRYSLEVESIADPLIVKTDNALQIKLPLTNTNKKALNHIDRADRVVGDGLNPSKKIPFHISINGELFKEGYVKINKTDGESFDLTLYSKIGEFFDELSKIKMRDLQFDAIGNPNLEHRINRDFVYRNWLYAIENTNVEGAQLNNNIRYIPTFQGQYKDFNSSNVDRGGVDIEQLDYAVDEFGAHEFRSYKQKPAIRVSKIIKAIQNSLESTGYKFSSDFFDVDNPYFGDAFLMLQSFQDKKKEGTTSKSNSYRLDMKFGAYGGRKYGYTQLEGVDPLDPLYVNGKFNFSDHINSNVTCNTQMWWGMNIIFNNTNDNMWRYGVRKNPQDRKLVYEMTPDQGVISEGGIVIDLDAISTATDYIIVVPPNSNTGHLCRKLVDAEAAYVINPDFGVPGAPQLNPNYDGRYGEIYWSLLTPYTAQLTSATEFKFVPQKAVTSEQGSFRFEYKSSQDSARAFTLWDNILLNKIESSIKEFEIVNGLVADNSLTFMTNIATDTLISVKNLFDSEMTAKQFLLEYCRLFGLYFDIDKLTKNVTITTRTNFYKGSRDKHWDGYLCDEKPFELSPIVYDSKYLLLNYKDDNKSEYTKRYKDIHNEVYGTQVLDTGYEFNDNKEEVYKTTMFNALAMCEQYVLPSNGGLTLPCLFEYSGQDRKAVDISNCLVFDTRKQLLLSDNVRYTVTDDTTKMLINNDVCWNQSDEGVTSLPKTNNFYTLPFYSTFREDKFASFDIARPKTIWTSQTEASYPQQFAIFPKFHEAWMRDRYSVNTKRFTGYFNIPFSELLNFNFKNFIFCKGVMWCVEKIEVDLLSNEPTKVTMISVDNKVNYIASQSMDVNYITVGDGEVNTDCFGSNHGVTVYTSNDWQVSEKSISDYSWIDFRKSSGGNRSLMTFEVGENTTKNPRTATIELVNAKGAKDYVDIRQESAFIATFYYQSNSVDIGWNDINKTIVNYFSNMPNEYITFNSATPDIFNVDTSNNQLLISLPTNNTQYDRAYTITATVKNYIGQSTDYVLNISQEARPLFLNVNSSFTIPYDVYTTTLTYDTNCDSVYSELTPSGGKVVISSHVGNEVIFKAQDPTLADEFFNLELDGDGKIVKNVSVKREKSPAYFTFSNGDKFDDVIYKPLNKNISYTTNCDSVLFKFYVDGVESSKTQFIDGRGYVTMKLLENEYSNKDILYRIVVDYTLKGVTFSKEYSFKQARKVYYFQTVSITPNDIEYYDTKIRYKFKSNYKEYSYEQGEDYGYVPCEYVSNVSNVVYNETTEEGYIDFTMVISGAYMADDVRFKVQCVSPKVQEYHTERASFIRKRKEAYFREGEVNNISRYMNKFPSRNTYDDKIIELPFEFYSNYPLSLTSEYMHITSVEDVIGDVRDLRKYTCVFRLVDSLSTTVAQHTSKVKFKDSRDLIFNFSPSVNDVYLYVVSGAGINGVDDSYIFRSPSTPQVTAYPLICANESCTSAYIRTLYGKSKFRINGVDIITNTPTETRWDEYFDTFFQYEVLNVEQLPNIFEWIVDDSTKIQVQVDTTTNCLYDAKHTKTELVDYKFKAYSELTMIGDAVFIDMGSNHKFEQDVKTSSQYTLVLDDDSIAKGYEMSETQLSIDKKNDSVTKTITVMFKNPTSEDEMDRSFTILAKLNGEIIHSVRVEKVLPIKYFLLGYSTPVSMSVGRKGYFGVIHLQGDTPSTTNSTLTYTDTVTEMVDGVPELVSYYLLDGDFSQSTTYKFIGSISGLTLTYNHRNGGWKNPIN